MREIISIHVGGAGNKIGERFFGTLAAEHRVETSNGTLHHSRGHHRVAVANSAGGGEPVHGAIVNTTGGSGGGGGGGGGGGAGPHHRGTNNINNKNERRSSLSFFPGTSSAEAITTTTTPSAVPGTAPSPSPEDGGAIHRAAAARMNRKSLDVYFSEGKRGRWVPRSVLVNLEPSVVDGGGHARRRRLLTLLIHHRL